MSFLKEKTLRILLAGTLCIAANSSNAVHALPCDFLKTNGTIIRNNAGTGDTVLLCGVNIGGWMLMESWMSPLSGAADEWTCRQTLTSRFGAATCWATYGALWDSFLKESDFQKIANEGLNVVRMVIYYHNHMDENGNWRLKPDNTIDFSRLDWAVATAAKYGMYTILDLHGVPGSQNGQDHSGQIGTARVYDDTAWQNKTVKFWQGLAAHFNGNAAVAGYDLMNEPSKTFPSASGAEVFQLHDKLYKAVRAVDPDHTVIILFCWNWTVAPNPTVYGWTNVVYEVHNYGDAVSNSVSWANACRTAYRIPYYIGEFTYSNASDYANALSQFTQNGIHWTPWTYKVKGSGSSWGMYTGGGTTPNVSSETSASIAQKWGTWDTDGHFTRNSMVCDAMKTATGLKNIRRYGAAGCTPASFQTKERLSAIKTAPAKTCCRVAGNRLVIPDGLIGSGTKLSVFDLTGKKLMDILPPHDRKFVNVPGIARGVLIVQSN
jgi:endoglucanase